MVTIDGRSFSDELILRINRAVDTEPEMSRRRLSVRVCEWMGWTNAAGRPREMGCRKALGRLERSGAIRLPVVTKKYPFQTRRQDVAPPPLAALECSLAELGAVDLVRVHSREQSRLWGAMMDAHHYLKRGMPCGSQLRYLVSSARHGWLGGLSFSASARHLGPRDAWIGWTKEACTKNRIYVVNNSRFLIAPSVKVPNLASHVLARCRERLADDWDERYGYRPVLLETYVDRERFRGTCYKAANWMYVGQTCGRGRQGTGTTVKDIYVLPLDRDWQTTLCRQPDGSIRVRVPPSPRPPRDWIEAELGGADLGDRRLTARLLQMTGMFYGNPAGSIPDECGSWAAAKAAYRFLDNEAVDWQAMLAPHYAASEERVRDEEVVLAVQDTTTLNYTSHASTKNLGPIGTRNQGIRGLLLHDTMAFTRQGTPLGLLDTQCWARDDEIGTSEHRYEKPIEDKESSKWLESMRAVREVQRRCRRTRLVLVADREADIHELFAEAVGTPDGPELLVRAARSRNRKVIEADDTSAYLWETLSKQPVLGTREILVCAREGRPARQAKLELRSAAVALRPPRRTPEGEPVRVWAVLAREIEAPAGTDALEWMLLTTVTTADLASAVERVEWYERRWGIEVYHRILKSGCRIEARQLEDARRLRNCLAIYLVVAWRIYHLTALGRQTPDVPCTVYFTDAEWKALTTFTARTKTPPRAPPTLHEAVALLGALGGHLGRASDNEPGAEVLWRGIARLADLASAYELYH